MKLRSLLTLGMLLSIVNVRAQTADEVIHKYLDAIGGTANWKKLTSKTITGKMTMMGMELPITRYAKPVNKSKMVIAVQGMEIVQAYDGKDAWGINPMGGSKDPQLIPAEQAKDLIDEFENEFIDYKKKGSTVKLTGTEVVDGVKCHKIELVRNGTTSTFFFDAENHVPLLIKSTAGEGPLQGKEIFTYISDYQDVNGLMVAFSTESKVEGQSLQKLVYEKVTFNEAIDDSVFAFPKK